MRAQHWRGLAVGAALGVLAWSAMAQQAAPAAPAARMDGLSVSQQELEQMLRALPASERAAVRDNRAALEPWLRQRLAREALLREARAHQWAERPEVRSSIDAAVQEATARIVGNSYLASVAQVPAGYPSPDELRAAYEEARPKLLERQPARSASLEEMAPQLTAMLRAQRQQALARAHLEKLAPAASVVVDAAAVDAAVRRVLE